jgi:hypothetical protein
MVVVKIPKEVPVNISFEDFEDYERVRSGGETNMFDAKRVVELSGNLTEDQVKAIGLNYAKLEEYFADDLERKKKQLSEME